MKNYSQRAFFVSCDEVQHGNNEMG